MSHLQMQKFNQLTKTMVRLSYLRSYFLAYPYPLSIKEARSSAGDACPQVRAYLPTLSRRDSPYAGLKMRAKLPLAHGEERK